MGGEEKEGGKGKKPKNGGRLQEVHPAGTMLSHKDGFSAELFPTQNP